MIFNRKLSILIILPLFIFVTFLVSNTNPIKAQDGFITSVDGKLQLNGQDFRFVGVNRYDLLTINSPAFRGCGSSWTEEQLDTWFSEVAQMKATAVRSWAFQRFTASGTDFSRMDYLLSLAAKYNVRLIPVFENQWSSCSEGGYKYNTWYQTGYLAPYGAYTLSYKDYVEQVVTRYKDNPYILMWQLMNEAESKNGYGVEDPMSLYNFTKDMSGQIKAIDANHLVSLGTMGGGQPGQRNENYRKLHSLPTIDVLEYHDYHKESQPLPGAPLQATVKGQLYAQDYNNTWFGLSSQQKFTLGNWTVLTATIPNTVVMPLKKVGINIKNESAWEGDIYLDSIAINSTNYEFETNTTEGFSESGNLISGISPSTDKPNSGSYSLKLHIANLVESSKVYIVPSSSVGSGSKITMYVYTPIDAPLGSSNSLAADLRIARELGKPLFVGEAGIKSYCAESDCFTPEQRASFFQAKLDAFFENGGAGYMIWSYRDAKNELKNFQFNLEDPFSEIFASIAEQIL